ncbi:MAG: helix-turn-helix domain-containing protein [Lachnospiraceae bacterium]|nr:helix-turn-helix domain-containing protein [Lachnospiraceae bacterium]
MGRFFMGEFKTLKEMSELWGISERRINTLCLQGRIKGAVKFGNMWAIPANTKKPKDERVKNGRYIKTKVAMACAE